MSNFCYVNPLNVIQTNKQTIDHHSVEESAETLSKIAMTSSSLCTNLHHIFMKGVLQGSIVESKVASLST